MGVGSRGGGGRWAGLERCWRCRGQRGGGGRGDGVFVDAVEEAFYYAKGDEATDVDAVEEGEVFEDPGTEGEALAEGGVEGYKGFVGDVWDVFRHN